MNTWSLEPMFGSLPLTIITIGVVIVVLVLVTPQTSNPRQRRILMGFRILAGLVLVLSCIRPTMIQRDRRPAESVLVIAVDRSRSMTMPDGYSDQRWNRQLKAYQRLTRELANQDASLDVRVLAYADSVTPLSDASVTALETLVPDGKLTDLKAAGNGAIEVAAGTPIAGVVLMGDGRQTAPVQGGGPLRFAETLNSLAVPLWTVVIGPSGQLESARDAAVDEVPESLQLYTGSKLTLPFKVNTRSMAGLSLPVQVTWIDANDKRTLAAERTLRAEKGVDSLAVDLELIAPAPGTYRLSVSIPIQEGELIASNNQQYAFVDVRSGGGRVLYLEGQPRLEQKYLRTALRRFPDLELAYQWIPSDTNARWPVDIQPFLARERFDAIIIGDLDAAALGNTQLETLSQRVGEGAGLLTLGGFHAYERGGYSRSPLAQVFPIRLDPNVPRSDRAAVQAQDGNASVPGQLTGPLSIAVATPHPIVKMGDNALDWGQLPPLLGANRFIGPKVAPGVQVLLQSTRDEHPLLVTGEFGRGRVACVAFDSTWRWSRSNQGEVHRRFWRQMMLWLLNRDSVEEDSISIELDARRFSIDLEPEFRAMLPSEFKDQGSVQWKAEAIDETAKSVALEVVRREDTISGNVRGLEPGVYRLRVSDTNPGSKLKLAEIGFQIVEQSKEMEQPLADRVYLQQLADITSKQGGAAFDSEQIDELVDAIRSRRRQVEVPIVRKFRLGEGPVSGWIVFSIFAIALVAEWLLRRRWSLP